ncbi:MAG: hypothetical protein PUH23_09070 [Bullifex porci]|nr:hypothetical protein [Bullifex porci]
MELYESWLKKLTEKELKLVKDCEKQETDNKADIRKQLIDISNSMKDKGINNLSGLIGSKVIVSECVINVSDLKKNIKNGTVITYRIDRDRVRIIHASRRYMLHRINWFFSDKAKKYIIYSNSIK